MLKDDSGTADIMSLVFAADASRAGGPPQTGLDAARDDVK
jgi:hypothetical protein